MQMSGLTLFIRQILYESAHRCTCMAHEGPSTVKHRSDLFEQTFKIECTVGDNFAKRLPQNEEMVCLATFQLARVPNDLFSSYFHHFKLVNIV